MRCCFLVAVVAHRTLHYPNTNVWALHSLSPPVVSTTSGSRSVGTTARPYVYVTPMKFKSISRKNKTTHRRSNRSATRRVRQRFWVANRVLGRKKKQRRKMDRNGRASVCRDATSETTRGWWGQRGWRAAKQQQPAARCLSFPFLFSLSLLFYTQRRYGLNKPLPEGSCPLKRCQLLLLARSTPGCRLAPASATLIDCLLLLTS